MLPTRQGLDQQEIRLRNPDLFLYLCTFIRSFGKGDLQDAVGIIRLYAFKINGLGKGEGPVERPVIELFAGVVLPVFTLLIFKLGRYVQDVVLTVLLNSLMPRLQKPQAIH